MKSAIYYSQTEVDNLNPNIMIAREGISFNCQSILH